MQNICEYCGNTHDGTYGSGRFCNKTCRARFIASKVKHHNTKIYLYSKIKARGDWKCSYCSKIFRTRKELSIHRKTTHYNEICNSPGKGWKKGLTAETSPIVKKAKEKLNSRYASGELKGSFLGRKHSEKTKQLISSKCGKIKHNGIRGRGGWYKGFWCDSSWELAWIIYNIEHNIKFKRCDESFEYVFNGKILKYYPDFKLEDETIVEIKGYNDEKWKAKLSQFPKNKKLKVLYQKEMTPYLDYVINKYGKNFISLYEQKKQSEEINLKVS